MTYDHYVPGLYLASDEPPPFAAKTPGQGTGVGGGFYCFRSMTYDHYVPGLYLLPYDHYVPGLYLVGGGGGYVPGLYLGYDYVPGLYWLSNDYVPGLYLLFFYCSFLR
jgi:hypothetical protein